MTVPPAALLSGRTVVVESPLYISAGGASVQLAGQLAERPHEGLLQSVARNLSLTLSGDTWQQMSDELASRVLLGLRSDQDEPAGWNVIFPLAVEAGLVTVSRESESRLEIQLPPMPAYAEAQHSCCISIRNTRSLPCAHPNLTSTAVFC